MRGRKPKPTHLHVIEGTLDVSKHRSRKKEPAPAGSLVDPPEWFTARQREVWDYAIANAPAGLLRKLDLSVLAVWAVASSLHRDAVERIAKLGEDGLLYKTPANGTLIINPLIGIVNRQAAVMLKAAAELGFSPASRARCTVEDDTSKAPEHRFFAD